MLISQRNAIEDDLAATLLEHVSGRMLSSDIVAKVESASKQIFFTFHISGGYSPPPALLEAFMMLCESNPSFAAQLLSCIIIISFCSIRAWNLIVSSTLFRTNLHARRLLRNVAAASNPCWSLWSRAEQENLVSACMSLSDLDLYATEGYLCRYTPVSVALGEFRNTLQSRETANDHALKREFQSFVHRIPQKIWGSIPYHELPFVLNAALEAGVPQDRFLVHLSKRFATNSSGTKEVLLTIERYGLRSAKNFLLQAFEGHVDFQLRVCLTSAKSVCYDKHSFSQTDAYEFAKALGAGESAKYVQETARRWMKQGHLNLVCAAYVGAPKLLKRIAGDDEGVCKEVQRIPLWFRSPIDQTIDDALSGLLRNIPEIGIAFCDRLSADRGDHSALKKAAFIYPSITLRRIKCLCAAARTVLEGLTGSGRYKPCCLRVIETLIYVFSHLPGPPTSAVEEVCILAFEFVVEEKRLDNGIPEFLSAVTVSVLRLLCRCRLKGQTNRLLQLVNGVIAANGTNELVTEAVADFKRSVIGYG